MGISGVVKVSSHHAIPDAQTFTDIISPSQPFLLAENVTERFPFQPELPASHPALKSDYLILKSMKGSLFFASESFRDESLYLKMVIEKNRELASILRYSKFMEYHKIVEERLLRHLFQEHLRKTAEKFEKRAVKVHQQKDLFTELRQTSSDIRRELFSFLLSIRDDSRQDYHRMFWDAVRKNLEQEPSAVILSSTNLQELLTGFRYEESEGSLLRALFLLKENQLRARASQILEHVSGLSLPAALHPLFRLHFHRQSFEKELQTELSKKRSDVFMKNLATSSLRSHFRQFLSDQSLSVASEGVPLSLRPQTWTSYATPENQQGNMRAISGGSEPYTQISSLQNKISQIPSKGSIAPLFLALGFFPEKTEFTSPEASVISLQNIPPAMVTTHISKDQAGTLFPPTDLLPKTQTERIHSDSDQSVSGFYIQSFLTPAEQSFLSRSLPSKDRHLYRFEAVYLLQTSTNIIKQPAVLSWNSGEARDLEQKAQISMEVRPDIGHSKENTEPMKDPFTQERRVDHNRNYPQQFRVITEHDLAFFGNPVMTSELSRTSVFLKHYSQTENPPDSFENKVIRAGQIKKSSHSTETAPFVSLKGSEKPEIPVFTRDNFSKPRKD